ncbi:hypothetical protein B0I35DRAFT_440794 [Stachybotrys elegans]|uniref:Zn(2)-C6 fungal-type domain-containing protein n=1 Tax=Stachybotrys elegans TaxID=80388 RepID=A0A8K0WMT4_9HYPO|nr:hypothetical protein B0I35DRAFT_440794 [Stachybotrys elegans]
MVQRPGQACVQCRESKRRCASPASGTSLECLPCRQRALVCSHDRSGRATSPGKRELPPPVSGRVLHLVNLYFKYIHDKAHSLFHEASFRDNVARGTAPESVLMAMAGLCARFSPQPEVRSSGPEFVLAAKRAFGHDMGRVSLANTQTAMLLVFISMGECDSDAASVYFAVASRMAQILNSTDGQSGGDALTRETKLRVWWSCFILDAWMSRGANLSRQLNPERTASAQLQLPMEEIAFSRLRPGDAEPLNRGRGFWACMVELVEIYTQIQDLQLALAMSDDWNNERIFGDVELLAGRMHALEASLEPDMSYTPANLERHISQGLGRVFFAFHLGYHHYCTLLFYLYLDHRRVAAATPSRADGRPSGRAYADQCTYHACKVSDMLKTSREREGCEVVYNIISHVTVVSSSVLLHTYLFGEVDDLPAAKERLQSNFETLVLLRQYWPSVELMTKRLVIFQNNCLRSLRQEETYQFDRWMIRFLLEHLLTLEDKLHESQEMWPVEPETLVSVNSVHIQRSRVTKDIISDMQGRW